VSPSVAAAAAAAASASIATGASSSTAAATAAAAAAAATTGVSPVQIGSSSATAAAAAGTSINGTVASATAAAAAAAGAKPDAASAAAAAAASAVARAGSCTAVASAASAAAVSAGASSAAASAAASAASVATCTYSSIVEKIIIRNEPTVVTNNVIHRIIRATSVQPAKSSPSATTALVDLETVRLGRSVFASNGFRPIAVVSPFKIIGGHVLLSSPSKNVKLVAASITGNTIDHAVIVDLTKVRDLRAGQSLYQTDLGEVITGTNPFTRQRDTVSNFTDLLLWNNSNLPITLSDDSEISMVIVYK
jgi:hypothetical protein